MEYEINYTCESCQESWIEYWDCPCNDKCPICNKEIEPVSYKELN